MFAVAGAAVLWYIQQSKEAERVAQSIRSYTQKTVNRLDALAITLGMHEQKASLKACEGIAEGIDVALQKFHLVEPQLTRLSLEGLVKASKLEDTLSKIKRRVANEIAKPLGAPVVPTPIEFDQWRTMLLGMTASLTNLLNGLE